MPVASSSDRVRIVVVVLGVLLATVSFAPWWTRRADGVAVSVWNGPHFCWLAVLLCLAVVAGASLPRQGQGERWAVAGVVVAVAFVGWAPLSETVRVGASADDGSHQLAWVLREQGAEPAPVGGPFEVAWGYPVGMCLMVLLLAALVVSARLPRRY